MTPGAFQMMLGEVVAGVDEVRKKAAATGPVVAWNLALKRGLRGEGGAC